jgi:uncharacterized protein (TIGR02145 family)
MKTTKIILSIATVATLATSVYGVCASDVAMSSHKITGLLDPTADQDISTKKYVDDAITNIPQAETGPSYDTIFVGGHFWLNKNLGATEIPTSWNDTNPASLGDLYQWGRLKDGHEKRDSGTQTLCSPTDIPGSSKFIIGVNSSGKYNWRTTETDCSTDANVIDLWSVKGAAKNGVCPTGWRVPSEQDFEDIGLIGAAEFFKKLNLSAAGSRYYSNGSINSVGTYGYYWTSSVDGDKSRLLHINGGGTYFHSYNRAYGFSVRCVK